MENIQQAFAKSGLYGQSAFDYCLHNKIKLTAFPDDEVEGGLLDLSDPDQREIAERKLKLDPSLVMCKDPH